MKFSPNYLHHDRITQVIRWIGMGWNSPKIIKHVIESGDWDVAPSTVRRYYTIARNYLKSEIIVDRQMEFNKSLLRYEIIFEEAIEMSDLKTALLTVEKKNKLLQLDREQELKIIAQFQEQAGNSINIIKEVIFREVVKSDVARQ